MTGLGPLIKKEILEQLRTYKFLIVFGIFVFFGLTTPLLLKYLPQILELAGTSELEINIPPPTAIQSLSEYTSTIGQIGVLVAVLMAMGSIANEIRHNTIIMTLSKPISRAAFVNAKLITLSSTFLLSLAIASLFCYAYTVWLIGSAGITEFVVQNLLLGLFLIFCLAVTLLFSSLFTSSLAAGGLSIAFLVAQAALSAIQNIGDYLPGKLLSWGNMILSGEGGNYWWSLVITVVFIVGCTYPTQRLLNHKDL